MIMPDDALARWLNTDPKENEFPHLTPYNFVENKPILMNDPTGESGIVTINKKKKTIVVSSKIFFYGEKVDAKTYATRIQNIWNGGKNGSWKITLEDGEQYTLTFKVTAKHINDKTAKIMIAKNQVRSNVAPRAAAEYNFIKIVKDNTEHITGSSFMDGNSGAWTLNQIGGEKETTSVHEFGHGLGLFHDLVYGGYHPTKGHFIKYKTPQELMNFQDCHVPHIMQPTGCIEDKEYSFSKPKNLGIFGKQYIMNSKYRKVTDYNIATLGINLETSHLGVLTNKYYGSEKERERIAKEKANEK